MRDVQKKAVIGTISIFTILVIAFLFLVSKGIVDESDSVELKSGWRIEINDTVYEDVSIDTFHFPPVNKGDTVKMSCIIPENAVVDNPVLQLYTVHSDIEVRHNGQIKYMYGQRLRKAGKLLGYGYHYVHLPAHYYFEDSSIQVIMNITEDNAFSSMKIPTICNGDNIFRNFIIKNAVPMAVNMFLIVFGILMVLVSLFFCATNSKFFKLFFVGGFSLGIGCWSLCNYDLIILFTGDLRVKAYLEFASLYIAPLFVMLYFWKDEFITRYRIVNIGFHILLACQIGFDIAAFSLQFANIVHFPAMLRIQHLILVVLCVGVIVLTIHDLIKKQLKNKVLFIGMLLLLVIGLIDVCYFSILKYWVTEKETQYTSILCIGAMFFVITQLLDFGMKIGDIFLQGAKAQVLEQMAYHDDMTGVANRRRCEELWDSLDESQENYGIFAFDLNFLKKTNDTKGHAMGDLLIKSFAQVLSKVFDEVGVVGRIGGDEFVVFIPDMKNIAIRELTEQLEKEIERVNGNNPQLHLSTAYGFCTHDQYPDCDSRKIYRKADAVMYENKVAMKAMRTD